MGAIAISSTLLHTVLVVDDEPAVRSVLRRFFVRRGWSVIDAESAEKALDLLATQLPDLVVCDLHLPGISGSVLCRRAAELHPSLATRLVLTSGDPVGATAELERESLDCRLLGKPFSLGDLDRLLETTTDAA